MTLRLACVPLLLPLVLATGWAADDAPKTSMKDVLKARIAEDARKADAQRTTTAAPVPKSGSGAAANDDATNAPPPAQPADATKSRQSVAKEAPTVMPRVEVKKGRITELDQKLAKQEEDIARERKNLKPSEVDSALNDATIAKPLSLFGGESAQFRQRVASERVELMEAEKDLMEAMARAKTKAEKQALQKQLDELKAVRRELEKTLR